MLIQRFLLSVVVITSSAQKLNLVTSLRRPKHFRLGLTYFFIVNSPFRDEATQTLANHGPKSNFHSGPVQ